jgi:hypothetical protein
MHNLPRRNVTLASKEVDTLEIIDQFLLPHRQNVA